MSCWDRLSGLETGLVLALIVSVPFLIFMIVFYLTVGQIADSTGRPMHSSKYISCEHACKCINTIVDLIALPPNDTLSYGDEDGTEDKEDDVNARDLSITDKVWLKIATGGKDLGTIEIGLFGLTVSKTVQNFVTFIKNKTEGHGYKGSRFHKVVKDSPGYILGGDIVSRGGYGSVAHTGESHLPDENFKIKHYSAGFLSMANTGEKDTNGCQFFFTTAKNHYWDGRHVVFGKIIKGMAVMRQIQNTTVDDIYKPKKDIIIADCAHKHLRKSEIFTVDKNEPLD